MRAFVLPSALCVALTLAPTLAFADEPTAADRTMARTLFEEGRALAKDGKFGEACPKLEESERLAPGIGTLFNLADCFENLGRTASAWSTFSEAADLARLAGQGDRETVARDRASALVPRLSRLKVRLLGATPPGLTLHVDGKAVSLAVLSSDIPVDPGEHRVKATATDKIPAEAVVRIEPATPMTSVELPALQDAPKEVVPTPPLAVERPPGDPAPPPERTWQKPVALVAGGVALVAVGVGAAFGLKAGSEWSDAKASCPGNACDGPGFTSWESSRSSARVSTIFFGTGAVLATAAVVLWLTSPGKEPHVALRRTLDWGTF